MHVKRITYGTMQKSVKIKGLTVANKHVRRR